ncbi:50S ribosomal protein L25/general stress protein Ctc [Tomitella fengzijianii]|uniref:Large ribosomal subunit protein bL25 n=1 Tax=Tomitella fengzijianii TaxID=2597660 RepID=A0A516X1U5_9ACTN|nr:50S ribosomal protein L25/general stress protein Ctc [Tomitella fengzijianii]QDQ97064.1 50S ribosomal protein L25/general stress protein Ctc [Tomitella fengzijianii]
MADKLRVAATPRTEFGKGAARRARRDGQVPAVVYGHGADPIHLNIPSLEFAAIIRNHGTNAILTLDIDGKEHMALTKEVRIHPVRNYIEHADLLTVKRGEKVVVEVPLVVTGEAAPGTIVFHDVTTLRLQADALSIPEEIVVSIEGAEVGTQILAGEVQIPAGTELEDDPELLLVNVAEQRSAPDEDEEAAEGEAEAADAAE